MADRFRPLLLRLGLLLLLGAVAPVARAEVAPGPAGTTVEDAGQPYGRLGRAVNLARMTAESLNGGLSVYAAAACMHRLDGGDCLIEDNDQGFVFRVPGGPPGWQQQGQRPSRETVIRVSADGRRVLKVAYNGSPRPWKYRGKRRHGTWS